MVAVQTFHHRRRSAIRPQQQKHGLATTGTRFAQRVGHVAVLKFLRPRADRRAQSLKLILVPRVWKRGRADANLIDRTQFAHDPRDRPAQHIRRP